MQIMREGFTRQLDNPRLVSVWLLFLLFWALLTVVTAVLAPNLAAAGVA